MVTNAFGAIDILFGTLASSRKTVDQLNKACVGKGLPPAFPIDENGSPNIPGNPDYRFEGFGAIVAPPQLSFWVHYKPDSLEHIELGRFTVRIGLEKLIELKRFLN